MASQDEAKKRLGQQVAAEVRDGMVLGVGTGSTAARAVEAIGHRIRSEGLRMTAVPTSLAAERLCRENGITLVTLDEVVSLDLAFDGADEVDTAHRLIKGRGAAHAREKVVAANAARFIVLADYSKRVDVLGSRMPLPVEVLPMAVGPISRLLTSIGARPVLRTSDGKDGPTVTDQGLWIVDAHFPGIESPEDVDRALRDAPGVLDHGLFIGLTTEVWFGEADGSVTRELTRELAARHL